MNCSPPTSGTSTPNPGPCTSPPHEPVSNKDDDDNTLNTRTPSANGRPEPRGEAGEADSLVKGMKVLTVGPASSSSSLKGTGMERGELAKSMMEKAMAERGRRRGRGKEEGKENEKKGGWGWGNKDREVWGW